MSARHGFNIDEPRPLSRPRSLRRRGNKRQTYRGRKIEATRPLYALPKQPQTRAAKKRELIDQAERAGWCGQSYRKAKRFERTLEHLARLAESIGRAS